MAITPIWQYDHGDAQATGRMSYSPSGFDNYTLLNIGSLQSKGKVCSNIVCGYSNVTESDILYFTYNTGGSGADVTYLTAIKIDESLAMGSTIPVSDILWTYTFPVGELAGNDGWNVLVMSDDGNTLYIGSKQNQAPFKIFAMNTSNGSLKWEILWDESGQPRSLFSMILDKNDAIIISTNQFSAPNSNTYFIKIIDNGTSATILTPVYSGSTWGQDSFTSVSDNKTLIYNCAKKASPSFGTAVLIYNTDGGSGSPPIGSVQGTITLDNSNNLSTQGIVAKNNDTLYVVAETNGNGGLFKVSTTGESVDWTFTGNIAGSNYWNPPTLASDGTIYVRAGAYLWSLTDNGNSYTQNWEINNLPKSRYTGLTIGSDGKIYAASYLLATGEANLHVITENESEPTEPLLDAYTIAGISTTRSIIDWSARTDLVGVYYSSMVSPFTGSNSFYYVVSRQGEGPDGNDFLYVLKSSTPTTTTTTLPPGSSSSTSSESEDTSSSTSSESEGPSTTTTTSTLPPSAIVAVKTVLIVNGQEIDVTDGSDSSFTIKTPFSKSLTFGTLSPNETSETIIVALKVPNAQAIRNIKLGLTDTGGLEFATNRFGVYSSYQLDKNIIPTTYFQGVNEEKLESSIYNIIIDTQNNIMSDYVYLNIKMPEHNFMGTGTVRFKWFFDYSD